MHIDNSIVDDTISIFIDLGLSPSYISPGFIEMCTLKKSKHRRSWLVQLATRTKEKVSEVVRECPFVMNGHVTYEDLNVLPLGSYDILIGMDWLEAHRAKLDCYNKTFACLDEEGNLRVVKSILK